MLLNHIALHIGGTSGIGVVPISLNFNTWKLFIKIMEEYEMDNTYQDIEKTKDSYMIKDKNGKIVSKLNYYDYKLKNFDWVLIANLDTKPAHRGKGLATSLINELYKDISNESKKGLYLSVKPNNRNAIRLYTKLKFKKVKTYTSKGTEYIIMAKGNADKNQFDKMNFG